MSRLICSSLALGKYLCQILRNHSHYYNIRSNSLTFNPDPLLLISPFFSPGWACCISVMASLTFTRMGQTDSCRLRLSPRGGIKKESCCRTGPSVSSGVSGVTGGAIIKAGKAVEDKVKIDARSAAAAVISNCR